MIGPRCLHKGAKQPGVLRWRDGPSEGTHPSKDDLAMWAFGPGIAAVSTFSKEAEHLKFYVIFFSFKKILPSNSTV